MYGERARHGDGPQARPSASPTGSPKAATDLASDAMKLHAAALPLLPASGKPGPPRGSFKSISSSYPLF